MFAIIGKTFGSTMAKAIITSAASAAASVIGATAARAILNKNHDDKDEQKSSNFGFSKT